MTSTYVYKYKNAFHSLRNLKIWKFFENLKGGYNVIRADAFGIKKKKIIQFVIHWG